MSLLTPWFLLGVALIAGPIIAHLIRRATRERLTFSALRFIDPSPPRLDRKSRVQNPWLLALRCLIVAILAFGFARPFLRQQPPSLHRPSPARHVVAVLDQSASMRRAGLWDAAREKISTLAANLQANDQLVVLTVGDRVAEVIGSDQWLATPAADRAGLVRGALSSLEPGWGPTPLDSAADAALARWEGMAESTEAPARRELVIVSDFTGGARVAGLANVTWPTNAEVVLEPVTPSITGNASLHWLGWSDPAQPTAAARVRVTRSFDAPEFLRLQWRDAKTAAPLGPAEPLALLPGASEVRLVPVPPNAPPALRLDLEGDDQDFDNHLWLVRAVPHELTLSYLGSHAAGDSHHPRFYIERAVSGWREPVAHIQTELPENTSQPDLLIVAEVLDGPRISEVRRRLEAGAFVLVLLNDESTLATAAALAGETGWTTPSLDRPDALLGQLDFQHPLFAPFADPLYSDFSRIRFWQPHPVLLPAGSKTVVAARFDDGSPAVTETPVGRGRLVVWGGDWSPAASQWVLSSKFVPWLQALAERAAGGTSRATTAEVGDATRLLAGSAPPLWRRVDGSGSGQPSSDLPAAPGLYELTQGEERRLVTLLVPAAESDTRPLALDTWEQLGVPLHVSTTPAPGSTGLVMTSERATITEGNQQLWRWLLWLAAGLLALESLASMVISRRQAGLTPHSPQP